MLPRFCARWRRSPSGWLPFFTFMLIGTRDFTDGQRRAMHIADDGNQYVYDDAGQPVFGVWFAPEVIDSDPPMFVPRPNE